MSKKEDLEFELEEDDVVDPAPSKDDRRTKTKGKGKKSFEPREAPAPPKVKKTVKKVKYVDKGEDEDEQPPMRADKRKSSKKVNSKKKRIDPEGPVKRRKDEEEEEAPEDEPKEEAEDEEGDGEDAGPEEEDEVFEEEIFEEEVKKPKVAKKMALEDGVKKRLLRDSREINRLKEQIKHLKHEMIGFENEIEYVEKEMEKVRSEKEASEEEVNKKVAIINALEKKLNRTQKDFEGYKGRIQQEIDRKALLKMKGMVLGVIEILDNFDRAISDARRMEGGEVLQKVLDGMESIRKNHTKLLTDNNIVTIEPGEEQFDPHLHEAIETMYDSTKYDNTVVKVDTSGYMLEGKVLRPARVIVSKGGPPWPKRKVETEGDKQKEDASGMEGEEKDLEEMEELEELEDPSEDE